MARPYKLDQDRNWDNVIRTRLWNRINPCELGVGYGPCTCNRQKRCPESAELQPPIRRVHQSELNRLMELNDALERKYQMLLDAGVQSLGDEVMQLEHEAAELILKRARDELDPIKERLAAAEEVARVLLGDGEGSSR